MSVDQKLMNKALGLKPQDKFILIELLTQSLDNPDKVIDQEWLSEASNRLKAHRDGQTKGIPLKDVLGEPL